MINLKELNDTQLHDSGITAVKHEATVGISTINHVIEANKRHLYSKYGCSSLHEYCVKYWKMTNGDAWRKISAAKLVNERPSLELKLEQGALTQTHLADAAVFFKKENFTPEQKAEALKEMENTSVEKAKSILLSKSTAPEKHLKDRVKQKDLREFLGHEFQKRKSFQPQYSKRAYARDIGLSLTSLNGFLAGHRDLSLANVGKVFGYFKKKTSMCCSWCGISKQKAKLLISGPQSQFICRPCVDLCNDIIATGRLKPKRY